MSLVYLVQGLTDLAWLAQKYFLKDELGASPAEVALFMSLANIPWMLKPLIGFVSDSIPLWGYRRRSYLLLASGAAAASWLYLAQDGEVALGGMLGAILVGSAAGAVSDVVVDSIIVERAREEQAADAGSLQAACWAAYAVGQIATAALSGSLVESHGPRFVFGVTATFPALIAVAALMVKEERYVPSYSPQQQQQQQAALLLATASAETSAATAASNGNSSAAAAAALPLPDAAGGVPPPPPAAAAAAAATWAGLGSNMGQLWRTLSTPAIAAPVAFLFLMSATPAADDAMFFFQTQELGFSATFLGQVQLAIAVASLAGVWLYHAALKAVPLHWFLLWGNLMCAALQCSDLALATHANRALGLDDHLFVLGGSVVTSVITNVLAMPTLVLAARLCPRGLEATTFAAIMALLNLADGIRYSSGAGLMAWLGIGGPGGSFEQLPALVAACNLFLLAPLPVLALVPRDVGMVPVGSMDEEELPAAARASLERELAACGVRAGGGAAATTQQSAAAAAVAAALLAELDAGEGVEGEGGLMAAPAAGGAAGGGPVLVPVRLPVLAEWRPAHHHHMHAAGCCCVACCDAAAAAAAPAYSAAQQRSLHGPPGAAAAAAHAVGAASGSSKAAGARAPMPAAAAAAGRPCTLRAYEGDVANDGDAEGEPGGIAPGGAHGHPRHIAAAWPAACAAAASSGSAVGGQDGSLLLSHGSGRGSGGVAATVPGSAASSRVRRALPGDGDAGAPLSSEEVVA